MIFVVLHRWHHGIGRGSGVLDGILLHWFFWSRIFVDRDFDRVVMDRRRLGGRAQRCSEVGQVIFQWIAEYHHTLEVLEHTCMRDMESWPLGPVPGVIHERLHLVMTENREMVHIVGDGDIFNR